MKPKIPNKVKAKILANVNNKANKHFRESSKKDDVNDADALLDKLDDI